MPSAEVNILNASTRDIGISGGQFTSGEMGFSRRGR